MNIILHGVSNIAGMANAAVEAIKYAETHKSEGDTDKLSYLGLKLNGVYYSIKFNKASVSVWIN